MLWVTDLTRRKQWQASPNNAGHIRDFYRLSDEQLEPVMVEKAFADIEGDAGQRAHAAKREQYILHGEHDLAERRLARGRRSHAARSIAAALAG